MKWANKISDMQVKICVIIYCITCCILVFFGAKEVSRQSFAIEKLLSGAALHVSNVGAVSFSFSCVLFKKTEHARVLQENYPISEEAYLK